MADIVGPNAVCTLNASTEDWGTSLRMTVDGGAILPIQDEAEMTGGGWVGIGVGDPQRSQDRQLGHAPDR